jgi:hypothetical protein
MTTLEQRVRDNEKNIYLLLNKLKDLENEKINKDFRYDGNGVNFETISSWDNMFQTENVIPDGVEKKYVKSLKDVCFTETDVEKKNRLKLQKNIKSQYSRPLKWKFTPHDNNSKKNTGDTELMDDEKNDDEPYLEQFF